jgi:hypothetical protein
VQADIDSLFDALLPVPDDTSARLVEAMRYAAIGGGKRVRPLLVVSTASLFGVAREPALRAGAAIEAIHVYSLIHDDLPCMDNDDLRHGKPTLHKAYSEATAVLAGDALHALAFEILADDATSQDPLTRSELILTLGKASGMHGMAGGQMMDMVADEEGVTYDLHTITRLQQLKTGALLAASVEMGAILGKVAPHVPGNRVMGFRVDGWGWAGGSRRHHHRAERWEEGGCRIRPVPDQQAMAGCSGAPLQREGSLDLDHARGEAHSGQIEGTPDGGPHHGNV